MIFQVQVFQNNNGLTIISNSIKCFDIYLLKRNSTLWRNRNFIIHSKDFYAIFIRYIWHQTFIWKFSRFSKHTLFQLTVYWHLSHWSHYTITLLKGKRYETNHWNNMKMSSKIYEQLSICDDHMVFTYI